MEQSKANKEDDEYVDTTRKEKERKQESRDKV